MIFAAIIFFVIITIIAPIFGKYIALVFFDSTSKSRKLSFLTPQTWRQYFRSLMSFNLVCILGSFILIYYGEKLPFGADLKNHPNFSSSLNAAISFATGTFWQSHIPEEQLTILGHVFAITAQNFLSCGTGLAVFMTFVRGIINNQNPHLGNFYEDLIRASCLVLLPLALLVSLLLIYGGVPQSFSGNISFKDFSGQDSNMFIGPIASQSAIKHLAVNGGSILFKSSAHPFEAPSRSVVMLQLFLIVVMPIASIFTYGFVARALKFSWSLYGVIILIMLVSVIILEMGETDYAIPLVLSNAELTDNFNYAGKELIFDKFPSLMWILAITMSSDGSVNACLENYSPLSTIVLFSNLVMSRFIMEGVGSGFFAMLSYLIVAVLLRGVIKGNRTNFFGKKISINEVNYVIIVFLIMPIGVLLFTSITFLLHSGQEIITYGGSQAITDIAYNFAANFVNNGSSLSGLNITGDYFNYMTAMAMFIGRYPVIYFTLAISGSFAAKQKMSNLIGQEDSGIEISFFLLITAIIAGSIMFLPLMLIGPVLEFINM